MRNPNFTGLMLLLAGYACLNVSWWCAALWGGTAVALHLQIRVEERHMLALHGDDYLAYASRVGRWIPFSGRLS